MHTWRKRQAFVFAYHAETILVDAVSGCSKSTTAKFAVALAGQTSDSNVRSLLEEPVSRYNKPKLTGHPEAATHATADHFDVPVREEPEKDPC